MNKMIVVLFLIFTSVSALAEGKGGTPMADPKCCPLCESRRIEKTLVESAVLDQQPQDNTGDKKQVEGAN